MLIKRTYPFGAESLADGVHFRVWAPEKRKVELSLEGKRYVLEKEDLGWFSLLVKEASAGDLYTYILDDSTELPDLASYYQPQGIYGPSCVFDSKSYKWNDHDWAGIASPKGQIIYELHVGTFTPEGTWRAALQKLTYLKDLGITQIEMMPIAEFAGEFGWGYDGIFLFAPYSKYGNPYELMAFIDKAHQLGIAVILDVVYNHFGPHRELHKNFSSYFFNSNHTTDWGEAINFDGAGSEVIRSFFCSNALYFLDRFHFDGLRFDATQDIHDHSEKHILKEMIAKIRQTFPARKIFLSAENEAQQAELINDYHFDAVWNDDFHHSVRVALTGKNEAYCADYQGLPQEILSSIKYGYLYQGQFYSWQDKLRGTPSLDIPHEKFIIYLENHDQIANIQLGKRLVELSHPSLYRALTMLFLLTPETPLLFQGQEFGSHTPFHFFADHVADFQPIVWAGRKEFLLQFPSFESINLLLDYPNPSKKDTFKNSILDWEKLDQKILHFHKTLIHLRKEDPTFFNPQKVDGAVIGSNVLLLRYFGEKGDRLILCNFGKDFTMKSIAEPLFAPPLNQRWKLLFSSEETQFGGTGSPLLAEEPVWSLAGYATYILTPIDL